MIKISYRHIFADETESEKSQTLRKLVNIIIYINTLIQ